MKRQSSLVLMQFWGEGIFLTTTGAITEDVVLEYWKNHIKKSYRRLAVVVRLLAYGICSVQMMLAARHP